MAIRIPFTNVIIGTVPQGPKRGLAFGRFFKDASRDFTGMRLSVDTLYNAYRTQGDVYACVRELREGIGRKGYEWVKCETGEEVEMDDLDAILNAQKSWRTLKSETVRDLKVAGNAFWALLKDVVTRSKVVGVQRLDPRTMAIVADEHGDVVRYIQRVGGEVVTFEPSEIIHFKQDSDPQHEMFGFSPLESVLWDVRTDVAATLSNYAFFENDAQPAAYYILDDAMTVDQKRNAADQIEQQFKGVENRHKSGIITGVKDIKTVSMSQKDMEFLLGRQFATDKICAAFGVPKFMLGYTDNVNYQNSVSLLSMFAENTITPAEDEFADIITRELLPRLGIEGIEMKFNPQNLDEEKELEARALEELKMGILTPRQYKVKTRQDLEPEDELNPAFDKHIVYAGVGAQLLENIGVDPAMDYSGDINAASA